MKTLISFAATVTLAAIASAQVDQTYLDSIPVENVFKTNNEYRYVLPAHQVFYGAVIGVQARTDSRYLAFVADPQANRSIPFFPKFFASSNPEQLNLGIYSLDTASGQSKLAYSINPKIAALNHYSWLKGTNLLLISYTENETTTLLTFDPQNNAKKIILSSNELAIDGEPLYHKPTNSMVFFYPIEKNGEYEFQVTIINLTNGTHRTIPFPQGKYHTFQSDGERIFNVRYDPRTDETYSNQEFDPTSATLVPTSQSIPKTLVPPYSVTYGGPIINIYDANADSHYESTIKAPKSATLTMNGTEGGATLNGQLAWYVDRSGLFLADIRPLSLEQYTEIAKRIVQQEAMSKAKQIGTGMMIYASDYDDLFPMASNWQDGVSPYIRNNKLTDGFTYLLNGESVGSFSDPSNQELGLVQTPFGTAVVRVDGSVIWKDRPKTSQAQTLTELRI